VQWCDFAGSLGDLPRFRSAGSSDLMEFGMSHEVGQAVLTCQPNSPKQGYPRTPHIILVAQWLEFV
jgi:hypothetical protein